MYFKRRRRFRARRRKYKKKEKQKQKEFWKKTYIRQCFTIWCFTYDRIKIRGDAFLFAAVLPFALEAVKTIL